MDDNKISHADFKVFDDVIKVMEKKFGTMVVTRGDEHCFLGITIKCLRNGRAELDMIKYLKKAHNGFGEELTPVTSPA